MSAGMVLFRRRWQGGVQAWASARGVEMLKLAAWRAVATGRRSREKCILMVVGVVVMLVGCYRLYVILVFR